MSEKSYIITDKKYNIIKIERSKNPYKDLKTFQIDTNLELEMVCVFEGDIKQELKKLLKNYKVRGEWYYPDPKTLLKIQEKYLQKRQELATFIHKLFGDIIINDQPFCFCWIDDEDSECQFQLQKGSVTSCESYEIWRACVRKEEKNFGD